MTALGAATKHPREEPGWTQEEFAEKVGRDHTSIARREDGKTRLKGSERPQCG